MKIVDVLRRYWAWWAIPLVAMLVATLLLEWLGGGQEVLPIRYDNAAGK